ncbi:MAG TPA: hypothetical protein VFX28_09230 [Methylomirabilota bacterium]|nr:hypothetical protein [Methylomirabilota bacterium]
MAITAARTATSRRKVDPPVVTVFIGADGAVHHARCTRRIEFQGCRGALELDFYCIACAEHITIPEMVLARLAGVPND